ncbi:MAG: polyketide cyclase, partial [Ilumatobacteraceae bacterium]
MGERFEVQRLIPASPDVIFRVLRDPAGHVAIDSTGMLMSTTGGPVAAVGDTFVVHMDREALNDVPLELYDVTVSIIAFEPDRQIEWTILAAFLDP